MDITIKEGDYKKFGVSKKANGYVFTFAGEKEEACYICFYDKEYQLIERVFVPKTYCMGSVRSVYVSGIKEKELRYNYEIDGKMIPDPYADRILGRENWNDTKRAERDYNVYCGKVTDKFEWEEDDFPEVKKSDMVLYKLHVRGFSMEQAGAGKKRGTFAAIIEKLAYLKELGVTTVELMPVYEFEEFMMEENQIIPEIPEYLKWQDTEEPKTKVIGLNYWGYGPGEYFAVKESYASSAHASIEFKTLIKQMHKMGMECVLEMFFPQGMNLNIILDALRFWVREYHVDGFHLIGDSIPVKAICQDVYLSRTKIFFEYYEGFAFEEERTYKNLYVYNEEYLYPARKLLNHAFGSLEEFANQQKKQHKNVGFVNFLASNNGFTLMDVFSYQDKHNEDNGEGNTDGSNFNFSNNCGVEGKTGKRFVNELRKKQMMNAFAMLFFSQGVPLIMSGDEIGNSQNGNNNAYCQDNPIGWVNWKKNAKNDWLIRFVKDLANFRRKHPILHLDEPMHMNDYKHIGYPDLSYHGENAWISGFYQEKNAFGTMYCGDEFLYIGYHFGAGSKNLALPKLPKNKKWYLVMNTSNLEEPFLKEEICLENQQLLQINAQSTVALIAK